MKRRAGSTTPFSIVTTVAPAAAVFLWLASAAPAPAQPADRAQKAMEQLEIGCANCHLCERPTPSKACLRVCTRSEVRRIAKEFSAKRGPNVVILDDLEDRYLPVPFDHKGHAEMAAMTGGCAVCHHYTPEGLEHPACKTCHAVDARDADIRKPGLKGAYHRQCMSCHREWSAETRCGACHHPKAGAAQQGGAVVLPTPGDLIGRMHPPIPEPDVEVYYTEREGHEETKVVFRHREHIHLYGLRCAECHRENNCNRCHETGRQHAQQVRTLAEHHKPCQECHRDDACEACHFKEGESPPSPFDHASTGWPLSRYHGELSCRACHADVPFAKQDRECNVCHENWTPANFDHAVTGQQLDDTHAEHDCEECHIDRVFGKPPTCDECHEEEEGITFPARRPGPQVAKTG